MNPLAEIHKEAEEEEEEEEDSWVQHTEKQTHCLL